MCRNKINMLIVEIIANTGWERAFNQLEDRFLARSLDKLIDFLDYQNDKLDKPYVSIFSLEDKLDNAYSRDVVELGNNIDSLQQEYKKSFADLKESIDKIKIECDKTLDCIQDYQLEFDNELKLYTSRDENVTGKVLFSRVQLRDKRLQGIINALDLNITIMQEYDYVENDIDTLTRIYNKKVKRVQSIIAEEKEQIKKQEKDKYKKLFNYKDLVKLAEDKGFKFLRNGKGDHLIYKNDKENIVVIPAHSEMKYPTMLSVQKMIYA